VWTYTRVVDGTRVNLGDSHVVDEAGEQAMSAADNLFRSSQLQFGSCERMTGIYRRESSPMMKQMRGRKKHRRSTIAPSPQLSEHSGTTHGDGMRGMTSPAADKSAMKDSDLPGGCQEFRGVSSLFCLGGVIEL
jgi:hypothetical protein